MTKHSDPCETARVRVLAAALVLQQCTKTAANIVPIPGKGQIIVIGTKADVARLLELAPATATTQASTAQAEPTIPCCGDPDCNACDRVPVKRAATSSTDAQAAAEVRDRVAELEAQLAACMMQSGQWAAAAGAAHNAALDAAALLCEQIGTDWLDADDAHKNFAADYLAKAIRALRSAGDTGGAQ